MKFRTSFSILVSLLVVACGSGCAAIKPRTSQIDPASAAGGLHRAAIVYRVYSTSGTQSTPGSARILSIKYPHPAGQTGYALAEAVIADLSHESEAAKPQWAARLGSFGRGTLPGMALGDGIKEAKSFDIPVSSLKVVLDGLSAQGYFHQINSVPSPVELAVEVNGYQQDKPWQRVAQLDQLFSEVRAKGRLIAFPQSARSLAPKYAVPTDANAFAGQTATALPNRWALRSSAPLAYPAQPQLKRCPPVNQLFP